MTALHSCPHCGRPTSGAWSGGGVKWAVCEECMEADKQAAKYASQEPECIYCAGTGIDPEVGPEIKPCPMCDGAGHMGFECSP